MVKIGLIGLGGIAGAHIASYKRYPDVEITAAADGKGKESYSYGMLSPSARVYNDYKEMIEKEELDAVDICAPSHLHPEISIYALEHGLHVLCEKPMALNYADAERISDVAKKSGKVFMCAQITRFSKPYAYLKEIVEDGSLGRLKQLFVTRLSTIPKWRLGSNGQNSAANGGVVFDLSIHDIDFVYSILGEPKKIHGVYEKECASDPNDFFTAALEYEGLSVSVNGGFYTADIAFTKEFYAIFENGDLRFDRSRRLYKSGTEIDISDTVYPGEVKGLNIDLNSCFIAEIGSFIECVKTGNPCEIALPESTAGGIKLVTRIINEITVPTERTK